ncbi:MAG: hypothetical protein JWR60_2042 [Polaromonas sp.]|nr:hypothetical protein [Polaromonas sp.]
MMTALRAQQLMEATMMKTALPASSLHSLSFLTFLPVFAARLAWLLALAVAAAWLLPGLAQAAPLAPADEQSVRAVVEAQLAALASDDAVMAFSFASPQVRKAIGTPARFMALVRASYPALYRPASSAFLRPEADGQGQVIQRVQLVDAQGRDWLAIYSLQQQKDSSWRIAGCQVVANKGRMA